MNEKLKLLYEELPKEAEQHTKGSETKKGYNTSGYGYQWIVDRLNEIYGLDWGYEYEILDKTQGQFSNGMPFFDITVCLGIWVEDKKNIRHHAGSHRAIGFGDALKGAISNSFKKTAAMFGLGSKAYRGQMDDDNTPQEGEVGSNSYKIDYNKIDSELKEINDANILKEYYNDLMKLKPSEAQLKTINKKVNIRKQEIETVDTTQQEFQGTFTDDDIKF